MIICGVDIETTGLDPKTDRIIEAAIVSWDGLSNSMLSAHSFCCGFEDKDRADISPIYYNESWKAACSHAKPSGIFAFLDCLTAYAKLGAHFMAHNKSFELSFLAEEFGQDFEPIGSAIWIDSRTDLQDAPAKGTLTHIAADHGILNPFPHRALFDTITMLQLASRYNWEKSLMNATTKSVKLSVGIPYDGSDQGIANRNQLKALGYRFNGDAKRWVVECRETLAAKLVKETQETTGFRVAIEDLD